MSSSGLIYAFIVGAWAVYLVPMWLRREDELNNARQTQRYTTAIKVLSHKESFERRYGHVEDGEAEVRLPAAVGQGAAPEAGRETLDRVRAKERELVEQPGPRGRGATGAPGRTGKPAPAPVRKSAVPAAPARRPVVHASVPAQGASGSAAPASVPGPAPALPASSPMLRARRRRVVGALFAVTSLGAIASMDLGLHYVWAMLVPAAALSGYIFWVRKDERARAAERARRHAVAVRTAREAHTAREAERREQEEWEREREQTERVLGEREEQARREAALRRRAAAARSRADRRSVPPAAPAGAPTDPRDLPRAANG